MMKQTMVRRLAITLLLILIAFGVIELCVFFTSIYDGRDRDYPVDLGDFREQGEFQIDPKLTLFDLENGKTNILTPVVATPEVYTPLAEGTSYLWDFSDYQRVADITWQQVWNDDLNDWSIFRMFFYADCQDPLDGFSMGDFVYFKLITTSEGKRYTVREILISPLYGVANWGAGTSYPRSLLGWKNIKLEDFKITTDEALQIAEENGGRDARLAVNNECTISLNYNPNTNSKYWHLTISHKNELPNIFEIDIDPYTGRYKIVQTDK